MFNKETSLEFWSISFPNYFYFDCIPVYLERIEKKNMTKDEKDKNPNYYAMWWYLKKTDNEKDLKHWRKKARDWASHEDKMKTFDLPNFDADIFEEITWLQIQGYWKEKYKFVWNDWLEKQFTSKKDLIDYVGGLN
jgi:hypothetical protein